jgi:uncharacterized protein (TIRG00374 family)
MKKYVSSIVVIVISLALLWWIFRGYDLSELRRALLSAERGFLLLGSLLILPSFMVRGYRWQFLFPLQTKPCWGTLFSAMMIGYLANNVLPARAGEFVRAYVLGKKEHISKSMVFATVLVERITDILVTLLLLAAVVWIFPFPSWLIKGGFSVGVIGVVSLACLIALGIFGEKLIEWAKPPFGFLPIKFVTRIESAAFGFISGVAALHRKKNLFPYLACTIVIWLIETLLVWSLARSFNLPLQLHGALFIMLTIGIGSVVPSSPGNVGTFEFFASSALALIKISGAPALCFVLVLHALTFLGATLIGGICLYISGQRRIPTMTAVELDDIYA